MTEQSILHYKFGIGKVLEKTEVYHVIQFEAGIERISRFALNHDYVFLSEEDESFSDRKVLEQKYKKIFKLREEAPIIQPKLKQEFDYNKIIFIDEEQKENDDPFAFDSTVEETPVKDYFESEMLLNDISDRAIRNIVIILNRLVQIGRKQFLRIIGVDVFTGKIVKIVDTNGSKYALHSYNTEFAEIKESTVIQATFKLFHYNNYANLLRITSPIQILGFSDILKLQQKYEELFLFGIYGFVKSFDEVFSFAKQNQYFEYYTISNFNYSKVKSYKKKEGEYKYQLKMKSKFVDILDEKIDISKYENLYFKGLALLSVSGDSIIAQKLMGHFVDDLRYQKIHKRKIEQIKRMEEHEKEQSELCKKEQEKQADEYFANMYLEEFDDEFNNDDDYEPDSFDECDDDYYQKYYDDYDEEYRDFN